MSDINLINIILQRLEAERITRQAEIRTINHHIQRFQQVRGLIGYQVRQRTTRTDTYRPYQEENRRAGPQGRESQSAPNFDPNRRNHQDEHNQVQAHASDESLPELETVPELNITQAEQEFIGARGYLDDEHRRTVLRNSNNRPQGRQGRQQVRRNRYQPQVNRYRQERDARIITAANNIVRDILRGDQVEIRIPRNQIINIQRRRHE